MVEEQATIIDIEDGYAWVQTRRVSACTACSANKGCGTGTIARIFPERVARMQVLNPLQAGIGSEVVVGLDEQMLIRGSLAAYGVPLLAMLASGMVGHQLALSRFPGHEEPASIIAALAGLGLGLLWLSYFTRRIRGDRRYQPVILRVVEPPQGQIMRRF
ncbi:MAG: SoxR reducing system RseC family protein [Gammaproteobacteria bacterium]|nr:SoxR reducing system RseC family protein [Gammaproteobacteria bacterium]